MKNDKIRKKKKRKETSFSNNIGYNVLNLNFWVGLENNEMKWKGKKKKPVFCSLIEIDKNLVPNSWFTKIFNKKGR